MTDAPSLEAITLSHGTHTSREEGVCAMEAAAWLAGEPHSDQPECVSPVIAEFLRNWNDALPEDTLNDLIKPLVPVILNTATGSVDEEDRTWLIVDWLVRTCAPAWLRLAGLDEQADQLAAYQPIDSTEESCPLEEIGAVKSAILRAARARGADILQIHEQDVADSTALSAARFSIRDTAVPGIVCTIVEQTAYLSARITVWDSTEEDVQSAVVKLQESAQDLVRRMAEVGHTPS